MSKMRFLTTATWMTLFGAIASHPSSLNISTTTIPDSLTPPASCVTITTLGPACPDYSCTQNACLIVSTITQSCGCASIYTARACTNPCTNNCAGTSFLTVHLPCPTSISFSATTSSESSHSTTPISSDTVSCSVGNHLANDMSCSSVRDSSSIISTSNSATGHSQSSTSFTSLSSNATPTSTSDYGHSSKSHKFSHPTSSYSNSTITSTSSNPVTITSCPPSISCTGQTTTWTSTEGPLPCTTAPTCTYVLPGGPMETGGSQDPSDGGGGDVTVTSAITTVLAPISSAPAPTLEQANMAGKSVMGGGVLAGLMAVILGFL